MGNINNFNELYDMIDNDTVITKFATDFMLELDVLPSVTTQAALNKMLVSLANRIKNTDIIVEAIDKNCATNLEQFSNWVKEVFTVYSYNLLMKSL